MSGIWNLLQLFLLIQALWQFMAEGAEPQFDSETVNVTAIKGNTAILPCALLDKGIQKIIWMNPRRILISTEDRRVIDDTRMSIERPHIQDWNLHIRNVQVYDHGEYTCQINTDPIQIKRVRLKVQVPALIDNATSSGDITVREGTKVELTCIANGIPPPTINWYKKTPNTNQAREHVGTTGETLIIHNISRYCGGIYECEASNGIPTTEPQTRSIRVDVNFQPEVTFKTRRLGQRLGKETLLECIVTASPHALNIWKKDGKRVPDTDTWKYRTEIYKDGNFTKSLYLRIINIDEHDFGEYTCEANNALGGDSESIVLYEYKDPTPKPASNSTPSYRHGNNNNNNHHNTRINSWGKPDFGGGITGQAQSNHHNNDRNSPGYAGLGDAYSSGSEVTLSQATVLLLTFIAMAHLSKHYFFLS